MLQSALYCLVVATLAQPESVPSPSGETWKRHKELEQLHWDAQRDADTEKQKRVDAERNQMQEMYRNYVWSVMVCEEPPKRSKDPVVVTATAVYLLAVKNQAPEDVLVKYFKNDSSIEGIWELDTIVGRDRDRAAGNPEIASWFTCTRDEESLQ